MRCGLARLREIGIGIGIEIESLVARYDFDSAFDSDTDHNDSSV